MKPSLNHSEAIIMLGIGLVPALQFKPHIYFEYFKLSKNMQIKIT